MFGFNNIRRYIRQNWRKLIIIVLAILFILVVIQVLNRFASQKKKTPKEDTYGTDVYNPGQTVIRGGNVNKEEQKTNSELIAQFVSLCNAKNPSGAYQLLTDECKENRYPTLESFINNYYSVIFQSTMIASEQSWINRNDRNTYQVKIMEDPLATGKYDDRAFQDYITIVEKDGEKKLNINGYVDRDLVNKSTENSNVKVTLDKIDQYKDYQICHVRVENQSGKAIMINTPTKTDGMYLVDSNDNKWTVQLHEFADHVTIENNFYQDFKIKVMKPYNPDMKVTKFVLEDMVLDANQYLQNKEQYKERLTMEVVF